MPTATALPARPAPCLQPRRADRRTAIDTLTAVLGRALSHDGAERSLRETFEETLRRLLPLRDVRLRRAGWEPGYAAANRDTIGFEVPAADPRARGVLECRFHAGGEAGAWETQTLRTCAQVAGLVLEVERTRFQLARAAQGALRRPGRDGAAPLIGSTRAMAALRSTIERVANTHFTVLIEGESGVGKELVARQIHDLSPRRQGPFVAVNCAAIVETLVEAELFGIEDRTATGVRGRRGKFEHADGGTLFLDEIGDLSLAAQAKLLRAIQELAVERVGGHGAQRVDVRIVAATNQGLAGMVERKLFRQDLFYRLSGVDVHVPPLRDRRVDILELAQYFLERHRTVRALKLSTAAAEALLAYAWPGNVRELERLIERVVALAESDVIELDDLPAGVRGGYAENLLPSLEQNDSMRAWGARYARLVLERCQGNKRAACRVLDISYHTLAAYLRYRDTAAVEADGVNQSPGGAEPLDAAAPVEASPDDTVAATS